MSFAARVTKLEIKHKQILRCIWCRFALHDVAPSLANQYCVTPESVMNTHCWSCGTEYVVPLRDLNEHQREALALVYNSHPTKQFVDERVHAAGIWSYLYRSEIKEYEKAKQEQPGQQIQGSSSYKARADVTWRDEKARREYEQLERQALDFHHAQTERFKRLAGESRSLPLDETLKRIEEEYPTSSYDKAIDDIVEGRGFEKYSPAASSLRSALATYNVHLQNLKKREACEIAIWGEPLNETLLEIEFFEHLKENDNQ